MESRIEMVVIHMKWPERNLKEVRLLVDTFKGMTEWADGELVATVQGDPQNGKIDALLGLLEPFGLKKIERTPQAHTSPVILGSDYGPYTLGTGVFRSGIQ